MLKLVLRLFCKTSFPLSPPSCPPQGEMLREQQASETFYRLQKILYSPSNFSWSKACSCLPSIIFNSQATVRLARSESLQCNLSLLRFLVAQVCIRQAPLYSSLCSSSKPLLKTSWFPSRSASSLTTVGLVCLHVKLEMWKRGCEPVQVVWTVMEKCSC